MQCPLCRHERFYLKDPDDPYETYGFTCESGDICFDAELETDDIPELTKETRIYCDHCAWSGSFQEIKK